MKAERSLLLMRLTQGDQIRIVEVDLESAQPRTKLLVLDEGRVVFAGSVAEFQASSVPAIVRLLALETVGALSSLSQQDPWDKNRLPREAIL